MVLKVSYPKNTFTSITKRKYTFEQLMVKTKNKFWSQEFSIKTLERLRNVCMKLYHTIDVQTRDNVIDNINLSDDGFFNAIGNIIRLPKNKFLSVIQKPSEYKKYAKEDSSIFSMISVFISETNYIN